MSGCPLHRLEGALTRSAAQAGATIAIEAHRAQAWFSATFAGHRHEVEASAPTSPALEQWLAGVGAIDLPLRGELLADLRVDGCERADGVTRFRLAGLTVAGSQAPA